MRQFILIICLLVPSLGNAYTVEEFFRIYERKTDDAEKDFVARMALEHYAEGIAQGILYSNVETEDRFGRSLFCLPKGQGLGAAVMIEIVKEQMERETLFYGNNANHKWPFATYAVLFLIEKFPCK